MRKLVWMVAALALAGCGEGKSVDAQKPQPAATAAPVVASYLAYYVFPPGGRTNYGTLVEPALITTVSPLLRVTVRSCFRT